MKASRAKVISQLSGFFRRNGYVRRQNPGRCRAEGPQQYKKGDEIRLTANSQRELALIRRLLRQAGFKPARPFVKGNQFRQPVYGRSAVREFLAMVGQRASARRRVRRIGARRAKP